MTCDDEWPHNVVICQEMDRNFYAETSAFNRRRVRAFVDPPSRSIDRMVTEWKEGMGTVVIVDDVKIRPQDTIELPDGNVRTVQHVSTYDFDEDLSHSIVVIA